MLQWSSLHFQSSAWKGKLVFDKWMNDGKKLGLQGGPGTWQGTWRGTWVWGCKELGLSYILITGHLQGPRRVCWSCALGFWALWARSEKNRTITLPGRTQAKPLVCLMSVLANIPSQLLMMEPVSLTNIVFVPGVKIAELDTLCSFEFNDNFSLQKGSAKSRLKHLCLYNGSI